MNFVSHNFDRDISSSWACRRCGATCSFHESDHGVADESGQIMTDESGQIVTKVVIMDRGASWDCDEEIARQVHRS